MLSLCGKISLLCALFLSLAQSVLPLWGYYRNNPYLLAAARPSGFGQFFFIACAYIFLTVAFVQNDFSIVYVASNSHFSLPLMYKLTAVWGSHEGSILLWIFILNIWTIMVSFSIENKKFLALVLAILGIISFSFLSFLIFTSNPFITHPDSQTGFDLNPFLQDPGFVFHPPMLYMGYVGFSAAFAITLAALLCHQLNAAWIKPARDFAIAAWCFLTFGIMLGSWWAYRVLGWGGFWFWDPVENASLLPWISGTALIHILLLVDKRSTTKSWAVLLAIISFALSLLGTFLVRSGVLVSVHTFASDPARGIFLLIILGILISAALIIYTVCMPTIYNKNKITYSFLSRENNLLLNSALLMVAMLTILLGTLYPLILDALHLGSISVGAPYFNTAMTPLTFCIMFFMGLSAFCQWQEQSLQPLLRKIWKKLLISLCVGILLPIFFLGHFDILTTICLSLSCWIILSVIGTLRFLNGMAFAHLGFAILVIGIMLSSILSQEREVRIQPGNAVHLGPYQFFFVDTESATGENYHGIRAQFDVFKNKEHVINLFPEKRIYPVRDMVMTKVDIHPGIFRDLYIALGEPLDKNFWSVRLYYKPFIRWIWLGGMMMILGGVLTILQRHSKRKAIV